MVTYNNLVTSFSQFVDNHFMLRSFSHGALDQQDIDDLLPSDYPFLHLFYTGSSYDDGLETMSLEVVIKDQPTSELDKVEYQKQVISDMKQIAEDILADFNLGGNIFLDSDGFDLLTATLQAVEEENASVLSGVSLNMSITIPWTSDSCNLPLTGVTPTPTPPDPTPTPECGCTAEDATGNIELDNVIGKYYPNDLTGDVTITDSVAVLGGVAVLGHNDSDVPSFTTNFSYYKHGDYVVSGFNRIVLSYTKANLLDIFISQPAFVQGDVVPTLIASIFDSIELDNLVLTFSENVTFSNLVGLTLNNSTTIDSIVSGNGTAEITFLCSANLNTPEHTVTIADTNTGVDGTGNSVTPTSAVVGGTAFETRFTFRDETTKIVLANPGGISLDTHESGTSWDNHALATRAFNGDNEVSYVLPTLVAGFSGTSIGLKSGTTYSGGFSSIDLWIDCYIAGGDNKIAIIENGSITETVNSAWVSGDIVSVELASGVPVVKVNGSQIDTVTLNNLTGLLTPLCLINDNCSDGNDVIANAKFRDSNGVATSPIT